MHNDVLVIGGGLSGLTAAALLAKRGLHVVVVDKNYNPGGSCGTFKRNNVIFDQGAAMLYGFGEKGYNAHRFVFNCLEEPIDILRHDLLYCVHYDGRRIRFWTDVDMFADELSLVFPSQKDNIKRFYHDMSELYRHIMVENSTFTTADETDTRGVLKRLMKHPVSYARFLHYFNMSAKDLLSKYFTDPEIFKFFNKLTSTYCCTTLEESPAVLIAFMFVDNHIGGSYYPAGSTVFLPGKLEKVIEECGGEMRLENEAVKILFDGHRPSGVELKSGEIIHADYLIYSGTVWNLYGKMIADQYLRPKQKKWAARQIPTYPSVILYAYVDRQIIPEETSPVEFLIGNPDVIDESEVTAFILSVDDRTLCDDNGHVIVAIGPTHETWGEEGSKEYQAKKKRETIRLIDILEKRFPGFAQGVRYAEIATPRTIERYTLKNGGAVAGPKQMLGQHLFRRQHTKSEWSNLFCCGESTVMGTGTPTVTTSGISAANAVCKKLGLVPYEYLADRKNYVRMVDKPFTSEMLYQGVPEQQASIMRKASKCQYCEKPSCSAGTKFDVRGIMRRVTVGNWAGSKKLAEKALSGEALPKDFISACEERCVLHRKGDAAIEIQAVIDYVMGLDECP